MSLLRLVLGRPLASWEESEHRVKTLAGLPMLGLDALGSAAYGPEAALAILAPLGMAGLNYLGPITIAILALLAVLCFSYLQTIHAYPNGGGSYTVASENLGRQAGLVSAASLLTDYILNAAVGISAGVAALVSVYPALQPYTVWLCLGVLLLICIVNLRGVRESGLAWTVPTYVFIGSLLLVLGIGLFRAVAGHLQPLVAPPPMPNAVEAAGIFLVLKAFASGCTAMTGVEAISNGVQAFHAPTDKYASRTLIAMVVTLGLLVAGIAYLSHGFHVGAMDQQRPGYQSVISQIAAATVGRGWLYHVTLLSVLSVLCLSANTSFAGFPRLCRLLAEDGFLPSWLADRGRRLVFSRGILALAIFAGILLVAFGGITDRLIPLFAVGAFSAFTASQAGMVVHWKRERTRGWQFSMAVNGLGAIATGAALVIVLATKFVEGAWISLLVIGGWYLLFRRVQGYYGTIRRETTLDRPFDTTTPLRPLVIVPMKRLSTVTEKAFRFGQLLNDEVEVLFVPPEKDPSHQFQQEFEDRVCRPMREAGKREPKLVVLNAPYRQLTAAIVGYVRDREKSEPAKPITVIIPELVEARWYQLLLHNQRATALKAMLYFRGGRNVIVINVPWYLRDAEPH